MLQPGPSASYTVPMISCPIAQASQDQADTSAYISPEGALSFGDLDRLTSHWVDHLHHAQIQAGDRIAVVFPTSQDLIALIFAAWRMRASIAILNPQIPLLQLKNFLAQIQPKYTLGLSYPTHPTKDPIFQSLLLGTSGSTGVPKIAILSASSLFANALHSIPLIPSDRWLLSLPLYHVSGIGIVLRCILARAGIVLHKTHPEITHLSFVPTQLYRESPVYQNLKCVLLGGAPIPFFSSPLPIHITYGLTEMGSMVLSRPKPPILHNQWHLGFPLHGREIRLAEDGEIWVRGLTRFNGYLENNICTPIPKDAWFATKDIGSFDPQEGFAILGRKDFQFICGGENIQPEEIEQHILKIPGVVEAIVIPQKDHEYGMKPLAIIHSTNLSISLDEITHFLTPFLPKYKIPKALYLAPPLPKKGWKIDRQKIISTYSQR